MSKSKVTAEQWISEGRFLERETGQRIFYHISGDGPPIVMLHGFPTWSYDYVDTAYNLNDNFKVIAPDFLGYGASDKPKNYQFSVKESADMIEELVASLDIYSIRLVMHDYGAIVGQELLDRRRNKTLFFDIESVVVLNFSMIYAAYRPTLVQKLLATPIIGGLVASKITNEKTRKGLNGVRGVNKLGAAEFEQIWNGISRDDGHKLAHNHIRYNRERAIHAARWEDALFSYEGPIKLIWGMADPVSGAHILDAAQSRLPKADILKLPNVGHFPQAEAPHTVADSIREFIQ